MKKMLMMLLMLSMIFIGGMKVKNYDFFIVNDTVKKTSVGYLYEKDKRVATITGKDLIKLYNKMLKEHQLEIMKNLGNGKEM